MGAAMSADPRWRTMIPGLFAQAGIAEELLFRGFLFGHLRRSQAFWPAARRATLPFTIVHLLLFVTLPWPIALAALLLSVLLSFPLAHLFELCGNTIWGAALLHFVVQGTLKVLVISGETILPMPLVWMAAGAVIPFLVFLVPHRAPAGDTMR
jgi:membrane protease YdiL (CAAX protease family)